MIFDIKTIFCHDNKFGNRELAPMLLSFSCLRFNQHHILYNKIKYIVVSSHYIILQEVDTPSLIINYYDSFI